MSNLKASEVDLNEVLQSEVTQRLEEAVVLFVDVVVQSLKLRSLDSSS